MAKNMIRRPFPRGGIRTRLPVTIYRRSSDEFSPTEIKGLALWLDASDSSTLFQNSDGTVPATASGDPVGYWGDKSGNGRHAVQATAGSRPTISAMAQNGRKQLLFDATNDRLSLSSGLSLGTTGYSVLAVLRHSGGFNVWLEGGSLNPYFSTHPSITTGLYHWDGAVAVEATAALPVGSAAVVSGIISPSSRALYSQSALAVTGAGTSRTATIQNIGATPSGFNWNGNIDELLVYSKVLTTAERQRAERYLAARWGITLAPQVANADAQDWIDRVYANGGSVSTATAGAVNQFCVDIDAASLRSKMLRLNLFCGTGLNACLTPLYRAASFGASPLGNAIDDNQGPFISADFLESTGLNGGAANSSKHLRTGLSPNDIGGANLHLAMFKGAGTIADPGTSRIAMAVYNGTHYYAFQLQNSSGQNNESFAGGLVAATKAAGNTGNSFHICSRTATTGANALVQYINGVSEASSASTVTTPAGASTFYIFGQNNSGSLTTSTMWRLPLFAYSLGIGMSAEDAAAYNTAMQSFHAAMGRPA